MNTNEAKKLALELMRKHGLLDWHFKFCNAKTTFGFCSYIRKEISLSKPLVKLNDKARVKNTILHEIAHALTIGCYHNWRWKAKAREIGCDGQRCFDKDAVIQPKSKYVLICKSCGNKKSVYRKLKRRYSCAKCDSKFNPNFILELKERK